MTEMNLGAPRRRVEDPTLLRGEGAYVDDIRVEGCLHAAFVRSPHGHARIVSIDVERARAAPGVVGVFTAADIPGRMPPPVLAVPRLGGAWRRRSLSISSASLGGDRGRRRGFPRGRRGRGAAGGGRVRAAAGRQPGGGRAGAGCPAS